MQKTRFRDLVYAQERQAANIVRSQISQINWGVNPNDIYLNDIYWVYNQPQIEKQLGRSGKVYWRLVQLSKL